VSKSLIFIGGPTAIFPTSGRTMENGAEVGRGLGP